MFVQTGTKVLASLKSNFAVAAALQVPKVGKLVVVAVYIPPVRAGFSNVKYLEVWDGIVEMVHTL